MRLPGKSIPVTAQPFNRDAKVHQGYQYSQQAPFSAQCANNYLTDLTQQVIKHINRKTKIKTVIDLGCGDGAYTQHLAALFPKLGWYGCDAAVKAINLAQTSYPQLNFFVWNLMKKNLYDRYDLGILRGVIHHLSNPALGIKHASEVCNYLIVIEPNGWNPILKIIEQISAYHRTHGEKSYTDQQLHLWCSQADFYLLQQRYVGLVPFFCPAWMVTGLKKIEPWIEQSWLAPIFCAQVIQVYEKKVARN